MAVTLVHSGDFFSVITSGGRHPELEFGGYRGGGGRGLDIEGGWCRRSARHRRWLVAVSGPDGGRRCGGGGVAEEVEEEPRWGQMTRGRKKKRKKFYATLL
jgi:hypothetical protein